MPWKRDLGGARLLRGEYAVRGIDTTALHKGDRLRVGAALLEVLGVGKEPWEPATYSYQGFSLLAVEGVFCRIIEGGEIGQGDTIRILEPGEE